MNIYVCFYFNIASRFCSKLGINRSMLIARRFLSDFHLTRFTLCPGKPSPQEIPPHRKYLEAHTHKHACMISSQKNGDKADKAEDRFWLETKSYL